MPQASPTPNAPPSPLLWATILISGLILIAFRLHSFELPLETDEANYAYIGSRLLEGDRLYVDVWDHQPPGVYVLFAAAIAIFGDAPEVFRWMATGFSLASLLLLAAIVRRVSGPGAAVLASLLFAFVSSDPGTGGEGVNREIYMNTFILAGWWCALVGVGVPARVVAEQSPGLSRSSVWLSVAGTSLAMGSAIKTVVAVHWLALAVWIAFVAYGRRRRTSDAVIYILALGAGPLLLWAGSFAYFAATGRLAEFTDAAFLFNLSYSEGSGLLDRFVTFFDPPRHPFVFESAWPLWMGTIAAVVLLAIRACQKASASALVLLVLAASYVATCMPAHFWPHYYYLLVPPCVVAVASAAHDLSKMIQRLAPRPSAARTGFITIAAVIGLAVLVQEYRTYLSQPPFGVTVKRYNSRDFWGRAQGENVRRVTGPQDTVFVYGNEAEIYYYSGRRCASRYTMITGLAEGMAGADRRREILLRELKANPPRLILLLFDQPPFEEWKQFLTEHYSEQPVGADLHDRTGEAILLVLARKDAPIEPIDWNWDRSSVGGWHLGDKP